MKGSGRWLWALPVLLIVGVGLIVHSQSSEDPADAARSAPTTSPSGTYGVPTPSASPTAEPVTPSPTPATLTPTVTPTASPTTSPSGERWSFCKNVSDVDDLRRAVLRGTKSPQALVQQAEELEAHLTDPRLDDLRDIVGRLRRAIDDAGDGYSSDFEVQGWAEALDLVVSTAQVQVGCKTPG